MKKITILSAFAIALAFTSCGSKAETAADYGKKYCDCVDEHKGQHEDCAKIMKEAKDKFPDGKDEFMKVAKECMDK